MGMQNKDIENWYIDNKDRQNNPKKGKLQSCILFVIDITYFAPRLMRSSHLLFVLFQTVISHLQKGWQEVNLTRSGQDTTKIGFQNIVIHWKIGNVYSWLPQVMQIKTEN